MSVFRIMSVCLSVYPLAYISKTTRPDFTKFSVHLNCDRVSRSSFDNSAIRYAFPVLWVT